MTLEKLKEHCKRQVGMYGGNVSTSAYLEHSLVLGLIQEHENRAKHDSELLDKVAEKFISWDSKVKGTREDGICFFTIENILKGIEEMKAGVSE